MNLPSFVQSGVDLSACNTLALPCRAAHYARVETRAQLAELAGLPAGCRRFVLGGGSNLVLPSEFDGLVVHMAVPGRELIGEDADARYLRFGGGERWHEAVAWTLAQGWPGLENLALIPGTLGAAPIQNIGAYGLELADRFHELTACDLDTGALLHFDRTGCRFAYRDSVFKQEGWSRAGRYAIVDVTLRLPKRWQANVAYADLSAHLEREREGDAGAPTPQRIFDAVCAVRRSKLPDPSVLPNAGSFFQNPVVDAAQAERLHAVHPTLPVYPQADGRAKLAAGWLIEHAGWKGRDLGPVGMYKKQALVLVNRGGAVADDVGRLMRAVQRDVRATFGVDLCVEPVFL